MVDYIREQIIQNCEAFQRLLPQLLPTYEGRCTLMHDGEIVAFYATMQEAYTAGQQLYPDTCFSVHAVTAGAEEG